MGNLFFEYEMNLKWIQDYQINIWKKIIKIQAPPNKNQIKNFAIKSPNFCSIKSLYIEGAKKIVEKKTQD